MPRFRFDGSRHALTGPDGVPIKLRAQSLEVFLLLLEHADEVVRKDAIVDAVWQGIAVTDDSLVQCVADIRRALGKEYRALLQTVPKIGYRLCLGSDENGHPVIGPIGTPDVAAGDPAPPMDEPPAARGALSGTRVASPQALDRRRPVMFAGAAGALALLTLLGLDAWRHDRESVPGSVPPHGPTMAVLPFGNASASAQSNYFSDGITEDIIASLSRFAELRLVSWSAVSRRSTDGESVKEVADEFGIRYLVSGSVRHDDERVRVVASLTDARDGRLLWSERYDEPLQDVFLVQDQISRQIAATLAVKLAKIETERSRRVPTRNMVAYQLSLLGRSELRERTRTGNLAARERFTEAMALDPRYADAHIRLGETYLQEAVFGWTEWPERSTEKALTLARTAIEIDGTNARALGFLAEVHVRTGEHGKAQTYLDRAFEFNLHDPFLHEIQGLLYLWSGEADKAIDHLDYVLLYDPDSTSALSHLGIAYYVTGRPKQAVSTIERMIETAPNARFAHVFLTAALVETGDLEAAMAAAAVVHRRHPFLTADGASQTEFLTAEADRRRFSASLRRAGLD